MIIDAMTMAQLQTTLHLLQEMESDGLKSLGDARVKIRYSLDRQHAEIIKQRRRPKRPQAQSCPECGKPTVFMAVDGNTVQMCRYCRWSALVEG